MTTLLSLVHDGRGYTNATAEQLREIGVPTEAIDAALATANARSAKRALRTVIERNVADVPSIVGVVADCTGLAVRDRLDEIVLLAEHDGNDYQRARLARYKERYGEGVVETAREALAAIDAGEIVLTANVKQDGPIGPLRTALAMGTAVARALLPAVRSDGVVAGEGQ